MTRPRPKLGGLNVHVFNRRVDKQQLFFEDEDFLDFIDLLEETRRRVRVEILEWCLMPNHWHLDVEPESDQDLPRFVELLCGTHAKRWRRKYGSTGQGSLYQRAYKAVPVQGGLHLERLIHYIHWNPVKAGLCDHPLDWRWGSARRLIDKQIGLKPRLKRLTMPTIEPLSEESLRAVSRAMKRGEPLGDHAWAHDVAGRVGLQHTIQPVHRPPVTLSR